MHGIYSTQERDRPAEVVDTDREALEQLETMRRAAALEADVEPELGW